MSHPAWLGTAALGGVSAEAQNELWTGAVAATAASSVLTAVATDLAAAGRVDDARGLLELAWWQRPGDRRLRRARKRLGLPVALTSTGQPWSRVFDPLTGRARPEPLPVPTERTLPAATVLGQALAARAAAVDAATCEAIRTHDAAALWPLLLWQRDGELPGPDSDAPQAILEELTEPDRAAWMSDPVRSCTTNDLSIWLGAAPPPRADLPG